MDELIFTLDVGYTTSRPVRPDEHVRQVTVAAPDRVTADLTAHDMIYRHNVVMVTSIRLVRVTI